jgi:hypothetical protein
VDLGSGLSDEDILQFSGWTMVGHRGIPITRLTRLHDGRVQVDVDYVDGTNRHKVFEADDQVMVAHK